MLAKLFIPVPKTIEESTMNSSNFGNKMNLSDDEVQRLVEQEEIRRAQYGGYFSLRERPRQEKSAIMTSEDFLNERDYDYEECETLILNKKKEDMQEAEILAISQEEDLSIFILNINPNSLTQESESELRYWIKESRMILADTDIPDDVKIKSLPFIDFKIETEGGFKGKLDGCKFVKDYASKEYKYYFAILVYGVKEN